VRSTSPPERQRTLRPSTKRRSLAEGRLGLPAHLRGKEDRGLNPRPDRSGSVRRLPLPSQVCRPLVPPRRLRLHGQDARFLRVRLMTVASAPDSAPIACRGRPRHASPPSCVGVGAGLRLRSEASAQWTSLTPSSSSTRDASSRPASLSLHRGKGSGSFERFGNTGAGPDAPLNQNRCTDGGIDRVAARADERHARGPGGGRAAEV